MLRARRTLSHDTGGSHVTAFPHEYACLHSNEGPDERRSLLEAAVLASKDTNIARDRRVSPCPLFPAHHQIHHTRAPDDPNAPVPGEGEMRGEMRGEDAG